MSPPLGHVEEVPGRVLCSKSLESNSHNLKEHDYIGLSEVSSMGSSGSGISCSTDEEKGNSLNLKETELRLGLPGSDSPDRKSELCLLGPLKTEDKTPFPLMNLVSGAKRGFSDAMDASRKGASADGKWRFSAAAGSEIDLPKGAAQGGFLSSSVSPGSGIVKQGSGNWHCNGALDHLPSGFLSPRAKPSTAKDNTPQLVPASAVKEISSTKLSQEKPRETTHSQISPANDPGIAPAAKAQVVGWPPIRSFRRTTMSTNPTKNSEEAEGKQGLGCLYVKVSMDGAPYLRKVDLKTYSNYLELSSALEKMFSCFTIGHCGSHGGPGRDGLNESRLMDFLHGSEYVPTYEDKDGDWMLVGDVPWEMFTNSCRRLRIMKGSEAIGLGMLLIYRECLYAVPHGGTVHTVRYWLNCASEEYKRDTCPINGRYQTVNCSFMQDCVTRFSLNLGHACACHGVKLSLEPGFKHNITYSFTDDTNLEDNLTDHAQKYEFADIAWYPSQHKSVYRSVNRAPLNTYGEGINDFIGFQSNFILTSTTVRRTGILYNN